MLALDRAARRRAAVLAGLPFVLLLPSAWPTGARPGAPVALCRQRVIATPTGLACTALGCPGRDAPPQPAMWMGLRLDLNRAPAAALTLVPGIGPKLAARIVQDRARRGPFPKVAAVRRVRGVGPKLAGRLAAFATATPVSPPSSSARPSRCP